jgi:TolA-binding protein
MSYSIRTFLLDLAKSLKENKISLSDFNFYMRLAQKIEEINSSSLLDKLTKAYTYESDKWYGSAADYYIEFYEEIKDKIPYSMKSEAKKFFETKISKMKYNYADSYYNDKDYYQAIDHFKEYIDDKYMTSIIKSDCKYKLALSLYQCGKENYDNYNYFDAKDYLEEALNFLNSNWQIKNRCSNSGLLSDIKIKLGRTFEKIAIQKWSDYNIYSMEDSFDYLRKANNYCDEKSLLRVTQLYYYLYKAYNESKSNRTSNLDMARKNKIENTTCSVSGFSDYYRGNVHDLYDKSRRIDELENQIWQKRNKISNLNYELNSIMNNINNTQSKINAKNSAISNKNDAITSLNNLANSLVTNGSIINNETENAINEGKNQVEQVKENIQAKKDFVEEISKLEKQNKDDIENMKNNNNTLKQKNEQLIQMLTALESKLN